MFLVITYSVVILGTCFNWRWLSKLFRVTSEFTLIDPDKVKAVANWATPTDVKGVRSFLGLAGYYRRFVRNFGVIARPLFNL